MSSRAVRAAALVLATLLLTPAFAEDGARPAPRETSAVVQDLKSKDNGTRLAAAEEAVGLEDDALTQPLVHLLSDERYDVRAAAIRALGARTSDRSKKEAASGLAARLPKLSKAVEDEAELLLCVRSLHDLAQPVAIKALLSDIEPTTNGDIVRERVMAVGNTPSKDAIEELIQFLSKQGRGQWEGTKKHVVAALRYATNQDFGGDPDTWRAWWRDNEKTFSFEMAATRRAEERAAQDAREQKRREAKEKRDSKGRKGEGK